MTRPQAHETQLRAASRRCHRELTRYVRDAGAGKAKALHRMRIALTRLRTAVRFFKSRTQRDHWSGLYREASWLMARSGAARDIDVALAWKQRGKGRKIVEAWEYQRKIQYRRLRRTLQSARYRRFISQLGRHATPKARLSGSPSLRAFARERLEAWRRKLVKKGRRVDRLGTADQHKLRLRAKRLKYALEWAMPIAGRNRRTMQGQLAHARLIQRALGKLNDVNVHRAQARSFAIDPLSNLSHRDERRTQQRLLTKAQDALTELGRLELMHADRRTAPEASERYDHASRRLRQLPLPRGSYR